MTDRVTWERRSEATPSKNVSVTSALPSIATNSGLRATSDLAGHGERPLL
jgi:hypothetical protein